jgi:Type VI secretion system effector, Hcp
VKASIANIIISSALAAAMFPVVAYALEIKTPTVSMPHIIVPHVTTPSVSTHIITPPVKFHVITPEGDTGSKITNTNSDNITIKDSHTKLHNETNGLQQQSPTALGGATGGAGSGKVTFNPFSLTRKIDIASPSFFASATSGASFSLNKIDPTGKASVVSLVNSPTTEVSPSLQDNLKLLLQGEPNRQFIVGAARSETVNGASVITVDAGRTETVGTSSTITVGVARSETVNGASALTVDAGRTETVGAARSEAGTSAGYKNVLLQTEAQIDKASALGAASGGGSSLNYLSVFERSMTSVEDPSLSSPAVGSPQVGVIKGTTVGRVDSTWKPQTYNTSTDLGGAVTGGAGASPGTNNSNPSAEVSPSLQDNLKVLLQGDPERPVIIEGAYNGGGSNSPQSAGDTPLGSTVFSTTINPSGNTRVQFGNGTTGQTVPTGTNNVTAGSYRVGGGANRRR